MPSLGDSLKGKFDPEVLATITKNEQLANDQTKTGTDPYEVKKKYKFANEAGTKKFSDIFWNPKTIPDIPIRVFDREDWAPEAQLHIPEPDPCWVWNREATEGLALALHCGDTTLLFGLQGTGKTELAVQFAAITNCPAWRMSCNQETREAHFVGSPGVDYNEEGQLFIKQEPTILTDSLKYGGIFIEDEAFRHNSALVLQSLRERNTRTLFLPDAPGRTADERKLIAPEGKWWYVLTDNTQGQGDDTGIFDAQVQDASTLDRIDAVIEVTYLGKPQERAVIKKHSTLTVDQVNGMLDFARLVRKAFEVNAIMNTFSIRSLLSWAKKTEMTQSMEFGLKLTWYSKLNADDKAVVRDMYHQVFSRAIE
jgi:cobaltochelatase CobS